MLNTAGDASSARGVDKAHDNAHGGRDDGAGAGGAQGHGVFDRALNELNVLGAMVAAWPPHWAGYWGKSSNTRGGEVGLSLIDREEGKEEEVNKRKRDGEDMKNAEMMLNGSGDDDLGEDDAGDGVDDLVRVVRQEHDLAIMASLVTVSGLSLSKAVEAISTCSSTAAAASASASSTARSCVSTWSEVAAQWATG